MLSNHKYNLHAQLVQLSKTMSRLEGYLQDCTDCSKCEAFWQKLHESNLAHINELEELIAQHS